MEISIQPKCKGDSRCARYIDGIDTTANPLEEELYPEPSGNWWHILAKAILRCLYYLVLGLKLLRPLIVLKVVLLVLSGDIATVMFYISGLMYTGMLYGIDTRLRNPGYPLWLYLPLFTFLSTFIFSWLIFYAAITIRKQAWYFFVFALLTYLFHPICYGLCSII